MKKVIVTGANGFLGSWMCNYLTSKQINVLAIVRNKQSDVSKLNSSDFLSIIYSDVCNLRSIKNTNEQEYDALFHFAWEGAGGVERSNYDKQLQNVKWTCDAMRFAKEMKCSKFITVGTITEKIAEKTYEIKNKSPMLIYGICKNAAHQMIDVLSSKIGIDYLWLTLSNIYGPFSDNGNIVEYTLSELIKGNTPQFSSGTQLYDLMYVEDTVKAIFLISSKENSKNDYYIGSGSPKVLKSYLEDIKIALKNDISMDYGVRPDDGIVYEAKWYDTSDLIKETDYYTDYSFSEGVLKTASWLKEKIKNGI